MPDDPAITIVVSAFFALFFGFQIFDLIKKEKTWLAIGALFFFGVSIAMVFIDAKTIMYGPDLRGIS
ncbi:MAG: hypothetical protein MK088_18630 [Alteromonas sp.]|nr:hypothetical protein [Alteromonas sp.]